MIKLQLYYHQTTTRVTSILSFKLQETMNISTFKGQDVYLRSQFQVSLTANAHETLLAWEKACFCGSCNEHLVVIPTMILMGKRPNQPKSSLSSHHTTTRVTSILSFRLQEMMNISTFKGQDVYLRFQFQVSV